MFYFHDEKTWCADVNQRAIGWFSCAGFRVTGMTTTRHCEYTIFFSLNFDE